MLHLIMDVAYCELAGLTICFFTLAPNMDRMRSILLVCLDSHMGSRLMFAIKHREPPDLAQSGSEDGGKMVSVKGTLFYRIGFGRVHG